MDVARQDQTIDVGHIGIDQYDLMQLVVVEAVVEQMFRFIGIGRAVNVDMPALQLVLHDFE